MGNQKANSLYSALIIRLLWQKVRISINSKLFFAVQIIDCNCQLLWQFFIYKLPRSDLARVEMLDGFFGLSSFFLNSRGHVSYGRVSQNNTVFGE